MDIIYGINAVAEALKARGRGFEYVGVVRERQDGRAQRLIEQCRQLGVPVRFLFRPELERRIAEHKRGAIKGFTHMDQAAVAAPVDLLQGLSNTVTVLRAKARAKSRSPWPAGTTIWTRAPNPRRRESGS